MFIYRFHVLYTMNTILYIDTVQIHVLKLANRRDYILPNSRFNSQLPLHYRKTFLPVLNWDTKAPVDWTGSVFELIMAPPRGESQVAAALKKKTTVPESQPRLRDESRSTKTAPCEGTSPERGKASKKKKQPSRGKTTPDKTKEVVKSNKKTSTNTSKKKPAKESKSDDDEDLISPEDEVSRETRGSAAGKRTKESKSDEDEDFLPTAGRRCAS